MKILYIGTPHIHELWQKRQNPSHWLYGACEMEEEGHDVVWAQENPERLNDLQLLQKHRPDIVFIPNLNLQSHVLLLLFAAFGIVRVPIYAYIHHTPKENGGLMRLFYLLLLSGVKHLFFLSGLSMQETIDGGYAKKEKCSEPGWGADKKFFSQIYENENGAFVSTGKEQRDFDILVEAFRRTGAPLKIITCKSHAGNNYEALPERCKDIPNIEVIITENTSEAYPEMVRIMAGAKALVCPLRQDKLNYCVGLSNIVDAEGLQKPLIITRNSYHSDDRMRSFYVVETVDDWVTAITAIQTASEKAIVSEYSIRGCYERMKDTMFTKSNTLKK
jgi:hypothetical protein